MKLHLPKKPPGHPLSVYEPPHQPTLLKADFYHRPPHQPTLLKADFYHSAEESAARRQAIMTRLNEKRSVVKAALRARNESGRLRA